VPIDVYVENRERLAYIVSWIGWMAVLKTWKGG
jgi:hypothetical protein